MVERLDTSHPGVRANDYSWGMLYEGQREALTAAGIVRDPTLFADDSKRTKAGKIVRIRTAVIDGRKVQVSWHRERKGAFYAVYVHYTPEERRLREEEECLARGRKSESIERACTPLGEAKAIFDGMGMSMIMAFNMANDPARPYRFPAETHELVKALYHELRRLFENGGFRPSLAPIVEGNPDFQRFMVTATGSRMVS